MGGIAIAARPVVDHDWWRAEHERHTALRRACVRADLGALRVEVLAESAAASRAALARLRGDVDGAGPRALAGARVAFEDALVASSVEARRTLRRGLRAAGMPRVAADARSAVPAPAGGHDGPAVRPRAEAPVLLALGFAGGLGLGRFVAAALPASTPQLFLQAVSVVVAVLVAGAALALRRRRRAAAALLAWGADRAADTRAVHERLVADALRGADEVILAADPRAASRREHLARIRREIGVAGEGVR